MLKKNIFLMLAILVVINLKAQSRVNQTDIKDKMQWFSDAKLGIFIHTGIYAVKGIGESWSFHNHEIDYESYMSQLEGFTLDNYQPDEWAELISKTGARYAVITSKHHDGVALYDTKMNDLSIVKASPAGVGMIDPLFTELRKRNIKCGIYYSLLDWSYPDYPGFLKDSSRYKVTEQPERWDKFRTFSQGQITELFETFNPDIWWFDGDWEQSAELWEAAKIRKMILKKNPEAIINGRLQGYGDYETPEQNFPVSRPDFPWWELCMTLNNSWGYQPADTNYKTPYEVITIFADVISYGGNLLLDIGPRADGTIPEEQQYLLNELGVWNKKHQEAVFNTRAGLPPGHFYGPTTLSADSTSLYLFLNGNPRDQIVLKGIFNEIEHVSVVGHNAPVSWKIVGKISWSPVPGLIYIQVPQQHLDPYLTVLKVKFKKPVKIYRGRGGLGI